MFFEQIMTPSRNINNKKQSADNRRSVKSQNFKIKRCLIRIKKFKGKNSNMRKVNHIEQKRTIANKRSNPIERKSEIRIIKSISNVTKPINKTIEKVRNNVSAAVAAAAKQKFSESSDEEIPKVSNFKPLPMQNAKPVARPVGRPPSNKKLYEKKILEKQQQHLQQQQQIQQLQQPKQQQPKQQQQQPKQQQQQQPKQQQQQPKQQLQPPKQQLQPPKQQMQQPQPAIKKIIESKVVEDTPTRSKRTPKPNRKYLNDSLITSFKSDKILRKINGDLSDSESESDKFNASSSDVDSDILRESDDSSTAEDEFDVPSRAKMKPNILNIGKKFPEISATINQKLLKDSIEKNKMNLINKFNQGQKNQTVYKQVSMPAKTIILNKYSYSQGPGNQSSLTTKNQLVKTIERSQKPKQILPASANLNLNRKRKLNESIQQQRELVKIPKISEKSSVKSDIFSDIEFNDDDDADNTDIEDFIKELTQQKQIKIVKKFSQQINKHQPPSQENRNISMLTKKPTILNKAIQQQPKEKEIAVDNKKNNAQPSLKKILNKDYETENDSLDSFAESDKEISKTNENPIKQADSSTLEDFEKMPTFTIVNINDIIGKKGDFLLEKQKNDPLNSENTCGSPDSSEENSVTAKSKSNLLTSGSTTQRNRRKAMHTNLLSENLDKNKDPPPRTPFPPQRKNATNNKSGQLKGSPSENVKLLNNNLKLSKSVSTNRRTTLSQKSPNKGPPRILNSMVAKKTPPITTFNTKVDTRRSHDLSDSDNETKLLTNRGKPSKENILKQQLFKQLNDNKLDNQQQQQQQQQQRSAPQTSSINNGNKRKLPSEKVIIQRQGNKIIKKITCFETWYVINLPPETIEKENKIIRNSIDIPLIQLANHAKQIDLPNTKWTCKVSLQKCTASMITQNIEPYTGEIYDDYINPDELHKYRPTNVMFRRQALHPTPKVPYDRAVIFKNNTFFTNIEGKNVKLIGAPHQIEQLKDIEILLNLVDDFSLKNQFVEQAPYVP